MVEHSAFALGKRRLALMTDVTLLLATMNTYIPPVNFSPCRTLRIMTKYLLGIHRLTPFLLEYIKICYKHIAPLGLNEPMSLFPSHSEDPKYRIFTHQVFYEQ